MEEQPKGVEMMTSGNDEGKILIGELCISLCEDNKNEGNTIDKDEIRKE